MEQYRIIKTGLKTQKECDILDGVFGQLSDGMWENSRAAGGYWPYIDAELENGEVVLKVSNAYRKYDEPTNKLLDMSDDDIKKWLAKKIKQVIKEEGLDWKRDNEEETDYLDTKWRKSKQPSTVADCYYVYEVLKGRNVAKHPEYAKQMSISDALKTLDNAKIKYVQQEDEPWESDLDESTISWPLLSEAELTPEQIEARRSRAKNRRELNKLKDKYWIVKRFGNGPYYVEIYMKLGNLGNGWWQEGRSKHSIYIGYRTLADLKSAYPGSVDKLLDSYSLEWDEGEGPQNRIRIALPEDLPMSIRRKIEDELKSGKNVTNRYYSD